MANKAKFADQILTTASSGMTALHRNLIDDLVAELGAKTAKFAKASDALADELDSEIMTPQFKPDAYRINRETMRIELYEVEVTHPVSPQKLSQFASYWEDWDGEAGHAWLPVLIIVNRFGARSELDLCDAYHGCGAFAGMGTSPMDMAQ